MESFDELVQTELGGLLLQLLKANHANKSLAARINELEAQHALAKEPPPPVKKEKP